MAERETAPPSVRVCKSRQEVKDLIRDIQDTTRCTYVGIHTDRSFNDDGWRPPEKARVFFEKNNNNGKSPSISFTGTPFVFIGGWHLGCHRGKDKAKRQKEKYAEKNMASGYKKKKRCLVQDTKKVGCPAELKVTRVAVFPDHKIEKDSDWVRGRAGQVLRKALQNNEKVAWEDAYYVLAPQMEDHVGHPVIGEPPKHAPSMAGRRSLRAVLIDLSGTLHVEDVAVPGAQEALCRLREASVAVKFVTNTTKESKRILLERLRRLNFDLQEKEIFTSLSAARSLLEQKQHRPLLLVDDDALEDFNGIDTSDPNAVVVGLAPEHFNYQTLNKAFRMILDGAPLVAIHKARYYKRQDGLALGPGPFVAALEYAADCKATVVGKPEETFFTQALSDLGCSPDEAVMIGDDARDDVGGAQNAGMLGILVRTGKYRRGDENKIDPPPHLTCDSFPDAVEHILKNLLEPTTKHSAV